VSACLTLRVIGEATTQVPRGNDLFPTDI